MIWLVSTFGGTMSDYLRSACFTDLSSCLVNGWVACGDFRSSFCLLGTFGVDAFVPKDVLVILPSIWLLGLFWN